MLFCLCPPLSPEILVSIACWARVSSWCISLHTAGAVYFHGMWKHLSAPQPSYLPPIDRDNRITAVFVLSADLQPVHSVAGMKVRVLFIEMKSELWLENRNETSACRWRECQIVPLLFQEIFVACCSTASCFHALESTCKAVLRVTLISSDTSDQANSQQQVYIPRHTKLDSNSLVC